CQQFTFRLVASDLMVELLAAAAADLGVSAEPEALLWIARESGGSVRDAYTLFDQVVSFAEGNITAALLREKLGLVGQDRMNALFGQFVAGDTAGALASLDAILSGGVSPEQFVADMVEYCRAILLVKNGITRESILGAPLSSFDLGITEALSGERIERVLSIFLGAYRNLKESIDPRYELDLAVAKASHINSYVPPSDLVRAVGALKRYLEKGVAGGATAQPPLRPAPVSSPVKTAPALPAAVSPVVAVHAAASTGAATQLLDPSKLPELKKALVADIRKSNVLLATTLDKSHSWRLKDDVLAISVQTPMECDLLKRFLGIVAELLALRLGSPRKVEVSLAGGKLAGSDLDGEMHIDEGLGPGESPFEDPGAGAGLAQASRLPQAFNERPRADAREPAVSLHESEAIGLVERLFKGSLVGYTQPAAPQPAGQAEPGAAAKKAVVIDAPSPTVEDDEALE
ncbi:MAG: hypothetical protein Q8O15_08800, partial [Rectinemataceae bacterium]|nr:hypothetical protein [Rectinemataceae bacterium]